MRFATITYLSMAVTLAAANCANVNPKARNKECWWSKFNPNDEDPQIGDKGNNFSQVVALGSDRCMALADGIISGSCYKESLKISSYKNIVLYCDVTEA